MNSSTDTVTTEQVQAEDIQRRDLIQMGTDQGRRFFREVLEVETVDNQTTGRRVMLTLAHSNGQHTMTDVLPFLTLTRVVVRCAS